ncbi:MAG: hypothetical protein AAB870_00160 [Patescibacteria group bacterium]
MKIMIVGSMAFAKEMDETKQKLETMGHSVEVPCDTYDHIADSTLRSDEIKNKEHATKNDVFRRCFDLLADSDAILALNMNQNGIRGYIGVACLMEIGLAHYLKKKIFILNRIDPTERYATDVEILGGITLNGEIQKIQEFSN